MQRNLNTSPGMGTRRRVDAVNGEHAGRPFSDMGNILPWFKVELLQVANDLSDVKSLEAEGAYFRLLRHLWMNGPQTREQLQRKFQQVFNEIEHLLTPVEQKSTDVEQVLTSVPWLEQQRSQVDTWRENKRKAGLESARVRSSKPKRSNRRQQLLNTSQQPTLTNTLSLTHNTQGEKERASETIRDQFLRLWEVFERHGVRKTAAEYWAKLPQQDRDAIMRVAPEYVASTSGDRLQYRKHLEGWINPKNRLWERPVIKRTDTPQPMTRERADAMLEEIRKERNLGPYSPILYEWMPKELREFELR